MGSPPSNELELASSKLRWKTGGKSRIESVPELGICLSFSETARHGAARRGAVFPRLGDAA